jgi:diguanylate cyclase (GGDEF)-like protein
MQQLRTRRIAMDVHEQLKLEQGWFHDAPYPMLATDAEGQIRWANQALETAIGLPASQLLGHDRDSLPSPAHRVLLGGDGLIQLNGPGVPERLLRCTVTDSRSADGVALRLHCYQDITEQQRLETENRLLKEQLEELQLNDALTGLSNGRAISQALNQQVSRSRRYDNPLSVLVVQMAGAEHADATVQGLARLLRDRMRWVDQLGRWRDDAFMAVLPETSEEEARLLADKIHSGLEASAGDPDSPLAGLAISFGIAAWQKGDDARTLLRRANASIGSQGRAGNG